MKKSLPLLLISAFTGAAIACTPYEQPSYIKTRNPYEIRLHKKTAQARFLYSVRDLLAAPVNYTPGTNTLKAEIIDFTDAVNKYFPKKTEDEKLEMISKFSEFITAYRDPENESVSMADYPEFPAELEEFQLFLAGREMLMRENPDHIPPQWKKLLSLPPEKRHYRTVWVHFMLGNHFKKDLYTHYDNCRTAAAAGFPDTAGLAARSFLLETRYGSNLAKTIRNVAHFESRPDADLTLFDFITISKINQLDDGQYFALVNDPVCREFLALLDSSSRFRQMIKGTKLRNADLCAYYAYEEGDLAEAKEFIAVLEKPTLLSTYIEAKIARHDGHIPLAVKKLRQWLELAEKINPNDKPDVLRMIDFENGYSEGESIYQDVYGMLGLTMVMRRDFVDAAKFFYSANQKSDLEYIAERFMSLTELTTFIDSIAADGEKEIPEKHNHQDNFSKPMIARSLCYLTARRAFREGQYDLADKYMPREFRKLIWDYQNFIKDGNNTQLDADKRAIALYNAAKIIRHRGMELSGTAGAPDYFPGKYGTRMSECPECTYDTMLGYWRLCEDHQVINQYVPGFNAAKDYNTVPQHQRFHYRYLAADLALRAGTIAEDEDLRALIHLFGGECLKIRSPQEADIFYKRLVLNSRSSILGKLADKQRWFPVINILQAEIQSVEPITSLEAVKELMQKAFPAAE